MVAAIVVTGDTLSHGRRIDASLTIAKAFREIRGFELSSQGRIKVDGTFA
jgi:hypothetical protein